MKFENMINTIQLGDCYELIKNIPDNSIDCVYIDIPYLYVQGGGGSSDLGQRVTKKRDILAGATKIYEQNKNSNRGEALRIARNKVKQFADIIALDSGIDYSIFDELCRVMLKTNIFIWCSKLQLPDILNYFANKGCNYEILVWCKTNPTPTTNNTWLPDIEYCLYFRDKGIQLNDGYDLKSKWFMSKANVEDKQNFLHPTIKPLGLVKKHLLHTTQPDDIVLDCFCGSGTTCVACKETGRRFIGIELDKKWVEVARNRVNGIDASGQLSIMFDDKGEVLN